MSYKSGFPMTPLQLKQYTAFLLFLYPPTHQFLTRLLTEHANIGMEFTRPFSMSIMSGTVFGIDRASFSIKILHGLFSIVCKEILFLIRLLIEQSRSLCRLILPVIVVRGQTIHYTTTYEWDGCMVNLPIAYTANDDEYDENGEEG